LEGGFNMAISHCGNTSIRKYNYTEIREYDRGTVSEQNFDGWPLPPNFGPSCIDLLRRLFVEWLGVVRQYGIRKYGNTTIRKYKNTRMRICWSDRLLVDSGAINTWTELDQPLSDTSF